MALNLLNIIMYNNQVIPRQVKTFMLRRSGEDRRKFDDPNYTGTERRNGKDRRSGLERRKNVSSNGSKSDYIVTVTIP